ncbi:bleomycin resistance protein [Pelagibius sp.]|uniref:bleomycin resistance protein n=1 Tax=Pelagibius sp. TaxID=1931238 RepID=UPI003B504037
MLETETRPTIESAMTIVPVSDVRRSVAFYTETLGFETRFLAEDASIAIVMREPAVGVQLLHCDDPKALEATANNIAIYFHVRGLDALYQDLKASLEALPEGRLRPPFNQPYGMREFHVKDPDGCLLFFGEDLDA